ncbi:MAG: GTPase Era [Leptospirillia bacterium]
MSPDLSDQLPESANDHRAGFIALAGCPNVGKSTLINRFLGEKVAIATPLPQTTRHTIRGVLTRPGAQVVFLDTPGMHIPRFRLNESMVKSARGAVSDADVVVMLVDASRPPGEGDRQVASLCLAGKRPVVLALNKWDTVPEAAQVVRRQQYEELGKFADVVPVTALSADSAQALLARLLPMLPEGPPFYPEEQLTDQTPRDIICELVREQVILQCKEEVPYAVAVAVDSYQEEEVEGEGDRIWATVFVERDSQKGILIGKGGARLKAIGVAARKEMERLLGCPVHLKLFIKVRPNWRKDDRFLQEMGYRF